MAWYATTETDAEQRHEEKFHAENTGSSVTWRECLTPACKAARDYMGIGHPTCPSCHRRFDFEHERGRANAS